MIAVFIQFWAMFSDSSSWLQLIYIRNVVIGLSFLCSCIQILDFLSFHHLFGPWAIIISALLVDTGKFICVLMLFEVGFSMLILSMNQPYYALVELSTPGQTNKVLTTNEDFVANPLHAFEKLFFGLFGLTSISDLKFTKHIEDWTTVGFKIVYAMYQLMASIVLINLLIAMMSDTFARIAEQSDIEWKYGLAKLIRNMHRTNASPAPINLGTSWIQFIQTAIKKQQQGKFKFQRMKNQEQKKAAAKAAGKVTPVSVASSAESGSGFMQGSTASTQIVIKPIEKLKIWPGVVKRYQAFKEGDFIVE